MLAIEAGGIAALIVGTVAVARSSAFSGLRKISKLTDVIRPGSESSDTADDAPDLPAHATPESKPAKPPPPPVHEPVQATPPATLPPAPSPAQRLSRALVTRRQAPGQASGGDGG